MLRTIATFMAVLWMLAIASSYAMGGWINILPVTAVILVLVDVIKDRLSPGKKHN